MQIRGGGEDRSKGKAKAGFIDVSQSVDVEHPRALDFLRMDSKNMTDYFSRRGLLTMTPRELFEFVVVPQLSLPSHLLQAKKAPAGQEETKASDATAGGDGSGDSSQGTGATPARVAVSVREYLDAMLDLAAARPSLTAKEVAEAEVAHNVFMQAFIPQTLNQVRSAFAWVEVVPCGGPDITPLLLPGSGP